MRSVKFIPAVFLLASGVAAGQSPAELKVQVSWGHETPTSSPYYYRFVTSGASIYAPDSVEPGSG